MILLKTAQKYLILLILSKFIWTTTNTTTRTTTRTKTKTINFVLVLDNVTVPVIRVLLDWSFRSCFYSYSRLMWKWNRWFYSNSDSLFGGNRFQNFWKGTHVKMELAILFRFPSIGELVPIFWNHFRITLVTSYKPQNCFKVLRINLNAYKK